MDQKDFDRVVNNRIRAIKEILASKAEEYATEDRLHNFNRAAVFMNKKPSTVCWGFAMKHFTSIADIVDDIEKDDTPAGDLIHEKISDAINYLILLEACIDDHFSNGVPEQRPTKRK